MALKRNLIANYLGQGWTALMGLAFVPLYIKYLGIEAYGLIGLFAVLQAWLGLLDMGMTPTLVREMSRYACGVHSNESIRDLLRSIEVIALGVAILIAGGVSLSSNWIASSWLNANALSVEVVAQAFSMMGLVTALRFMESVYRSAIVGLQRQVMLNAINALMATLRGLGAVLVLMWVSPTIAVFFLWQGILSVVTLVILGAVTYGSIPKGIRGGRFSLDALHRVWRFAGGILCTTVLAAILTQTDKVILSGSLDLQGWGYYSFATAIAGSLSLLASPIHQALIPQLNEAVASNNKTKLIKIFHLGSQITTVVIGSISLVVILYSDLILIMWTRSEELSLSVQYLVQLLVLGKMINSLMLVPFEVQLAYGWTSLGVKANFFAIILFVPALLIVVPRYSSIGAAWIWIALNVGYFIVVISLMHSKILKAEKWRWYFHDVAIPILASFLALMIFKVFFTISSDMFFNLLMLIVAVMISFGASVISASQLRSYVFFYLKHYRFYGRF